MNISRSSICVVIVLFIVGMSTNLCAQLAIDFDVVDSDGLSHALYDDYLNQDKSVVLKIFFTSCPPCRSIAPAFQDLYEQWGSGSQDVEFIELSVLTSDNDSRVNGYKTELGLTMPGVGASGGSVPVTRAYTDGTFGPYLGTPTFIVISPDGSVNYDVRGSGNAGTIEAINQAIIDSRNMVTPDPPLLNVRISTIEGNIVTGPLTLHLSPTADAPIDAVPQIIDLISDAQNRYILEIEQLPLAEFYNARLSFGKDKAVDAGLTTLDLIRIQRHILGIDVFTDPLQFLAADANFDNQVNVLDLLLIQQTIIGLNISFVNENYIIANECHRLSREFTFSELENSTCANDFKLFKTGDVFPWN